MTFLHQLLLRARSVFFASIVILLLAVVYNFYARGVSGSEFLSYVPSTRVAQHQALANVLTSSEPTPLQTKGSTSLSECTSRQLKLLADRVNYVSVVDSSKQPKDILVALSAAMNSVRPATCREFLTAVDRVVQILKASPNGVNNEQVGRLIGQSLTEDVAWARTLPCMFWGPSDERVLLRGPLSSCHREGVRLPTTSAVDPVRVLGEIAYQRYANEPLVKEAVLGRSSVLLTLDPVVQRVLNSISDCAQQFSSCSSAIGPLLADLAGATVVVMDPMQGRVLGLLCVGPRCQSGDRRHFGHHAAMMVEAPMASTAKLFFALAFAQDRTISQRELEFQIKTSGQLDPLALKRNEWWEKMAICDGQASRDCQRANRAQQISLEFLFNKQCSPLTINCGRTAVMPNETRPFASIGRFVSIAKNAVETSPSSFISWDRYDAVRQEKQRPASVDRVAYANTSAAVQSVIGAGDNRISALGLAVLSANIFQWSIGGAVQAPTLLQNITERTFMSGGVPINAASMKNAASVVYSGMKRVMGPAESGWTGDGTGHRAFVEAFKRSCGLGCPMAGKTGTVSLKDPGFPSTTLFTALANLSELSGNEHRRSIEPRLIALGVIAFPKDPNRSKSGHLASRLGTQIVRDIVEGR